MYKTKILKCVAEQILAPPPNPEGGGGGLANRLRTSQQPQSSPDLADLNHPPLGKKSIDVVALFSWCVLIFSQTPSNFPLTPRKSHINYSIKKNMLVPFFFLAILLAYIPMENVFIHCAITCTNKSNYSGESTSACSVCDTNTNRLGNRFMMRLETELALISSTISGADAHFVSLWSELSSIFFAIINTPHAKKIWTGFQTTHSSNGCDWKYNMTLYWAYRPLL